MRYPAIEAHHRNQYEIYAAAQLIAAHETLLQQDLGTHYAAIDNFNFPQALVLLETATATLNTPHSPS